MNDKTHDAMTGPYQDERNDRRSSISSKLRPVNLTQDKLIIIHAPLLSILLRIIVGLERQRLHQLFQLPTLLENFGIARKELASRRGIASRRPSACDFVSARRHQLAIRGAKPGDQQLDPLALIVRPQPATAA